jgi:hypothetical protein
MGSGEEKFPRGIRCYNDLPGGCGSAPHAATQTYVNRD